MDDAVNLILIFLSLCVFQQSLNIFNVLLIIVNVSLLISLPDILNEELVFVWLS